MSDPNDPGNVPPYTRDEWHKIWTRHMQESGDRQPYTESRWAELWNKVANIGYATEVIEKACEEAHEHALTWYPGSYGHQLYHQAREDYFTNELVTPAEGGKPKKLWRPTQERMLEIANKLAREIGVLTPNDPYSQPYDVDFWVDLLNFAAEKGHSESAIEAAAREAGDYARFESSPQRGIIRGENFSSGPAMIISRKFCVSPRTISKMMKAVSAKNEAVHAAVLKARAHDAEAQKVKEAQMAADAQRVAAQESDALMAGAANKKAEASVIFPDNHVTPTRATGDNLWTDHPDTKVTLKAVNKLSLGSSKKPKVPVDTLEQFLQNKLKAAAPPSPEIQSVKSGEATAKTESGGTGGVIEGHFDWVGQGYTYHARRSDEEKARLQQVKRVQKAFAEIKSFAPRCLTPLQHTMIEYLSREREALEKGVQYKGIAAEKFL